MSGAATSEIGASASEMLVHPVHARLTPFVDSIVGYFISGEEPGIHLGLPSRSITVILAFDDPLHLTMFPERNASPTDHLHMASGIHRGAVEIHHNGFQHGIQLSLTPLGVRAIFEMPSGELSGHAVGLDALMTGGVASELYERAATATSWRERFAVLDEVLFAAINRADPARVGGAHDAATTSWRLLCRSGGRLGISALANELGWSRRLITARFSEEYGLSPKAMASVLRFEASRDRIEQNPHTPLADIASECGFADQAHMTREWRSIATTTPSAWRAQRFPNLQDAGDGEERR